MVTVSTSQRDKTHGYDKVIYSLHDIDLSTRQWYSDTLDKKKFCEWVLLNGLSGAIYNIGHKLYHDDWLTIYTHFSNTKYIS